MMDYPIDVYRRKEHFVTRKIADESIIVPVAEDVGDLESVYTIGEVGGYIWDRLDGRHEIDEIASEVCRRYEVDEEMAKVHVSEFVTALETAGLVERVEEESK